MPQLRKDPITGRWVIIATERASRPVDFGVVKDLQTEVCPFCGGHENETPPEIASFRKEGTRPDEPGWWTRVVPDHNPLLYSSIPLEKKAQGMYDLMSCFGSHELLIETPNHKGCITNLAHYKIVSWLKMCCQRIIELKKDSRLKCVLIVKNYGTEAGASFSHSHSHSHLVALPVVPKRLSDELKGGQKYYSMKDRCVFCDIAIQEKELDERLVYSDLGYSVFSPFASRFPYELCLMPDRHMACFEDCNDDDLERLAKVLKISAGKVFTALNSPAYNMIFHTAPFDSRYQPCFHWHIEIFPRLSKTAGFEWGTGFYINSTTPESATEKLKNTEFIIDNENL